MRPHQAPHLGSDLTNSAPAPPLSATSSVESGVGPFLRALRRRGCAPGTVQAYRTDLSQFALFLHPRMQAVWGLQHVDTDHIRQFVEELGRRGCQPRTIARKLASVRSFFRFLCGDGVLESNPAVAVDAAAPATRPQALPSDGIERALGDSGGDDFRATRNRAILEVLYGAGLRLHELVGLNLSSLRLDDGVLVLQAGVDSHPRRVPAGSRAVAALASYLIRRADLLVDREMGQVEAGALFVNERGLRLHRRTVQRIVGRGLPGGAAEAPPPPSSPQLLRNSFATHLIDGGAAVGVVQALLGQASLPIARRGPSSVAALRAMYDRAHPRARRAASASESPERALTEQAEIE